MNKKNFFLIKSFFSNVYDSNSLILIPKFQILSALIMIGASTCPSVIARDYCYHIYYLNNA